MKTNYADLEPIYQKIKREGKEGWRGEYQDFEDLIMHYRDEGHAPKTGRVLGLGCGAGNMMLWMASLGYNAIGVDIAPTAIEWAKERAAESGLNARFILGSVLDLDLADECVDFALDENCFHCIIGTDRTTFLAEAYRVLKPGGYLLIYSMCQPYDYENHNPPHNLLYDPDAKVIFRGDVAVRYIPEADEMLNEVQKAGFQVVSQYVRKDDPDDPNHTMNIEAIKPA